MVSDIIMFCYYLISALVAFILIREIIRTKNVQETILFGIILIPFILRVLRIK